MNLITENGEKILVEYVRLNSIDFFSPGKWAKPSQSVGRNTEKNWSGLNS